jgi:hypothetical protein
MSDKKNAFVKFGEEIGNLVAEKNEAYGDSFGKIGLTVVRVIDKLFRIATKKDAFGESPWKDICGYGLLGWRRDEEKKTS